MRNDVLRHLRRSLVVACALFWFCGGCHAIRPELQEEYIRPGLSQDWHRLFDECRASIRSGMSQRKIPGLSMALVDCEGPIWTAGFGYTDYDLKTPVTPDTLFGTQSVSKTFTGTLVMLAVQEGLVDLDAPISRYLPDFTVKSRFEANPQEKITLRHLLRHTAGFVHEAPVGNGFETRFGSFEAHIRSISETWLKFPVGEGCSYSNLGFDLAAYIIEKRSGRPFGAYMQEKLLNPLGMSSSSLDTDLIRGHPNRAVGHEPHMKTAPVEIASLGAAGVYTCASDLARFVQFHLNWGDVNGRNVLRRELVESMSTSQPGLGVAVEPRHSVSAERDPAVDPDVFRFCLLSHTGGGFGFVSYVGWIPEYGIGVLCLSNSTTNADHVGMRALFRVTDELVVRGLVERKPVHPAWKAAVAESEHPRPYKGLDPDGFTPYKRPWKPYTGTYERVCDLDLRTYVRVALALGFPGLRVKVYERGGYLEVDGQRLDEYEPGVYFTVDGECLDFSGSQPLWRGARIKKK